MLPRQGGRFIIADSCLDWQDDGADLWRWTQPHVDAKDIAVPVKRGQQLNHSPTITHRRLRHIITLAVGQGFGIEQEYRVNVGRIIQLPPAMFAQRNDGKALIRRTGHAFLYRGGDSLIQRMVGKVGEDVRDARQVPDIG